jgi:hypothetical protein
MAIQRLTTRLDILPTRHGSLLRPVQKYYQWRTLSFLLVQHSAKFRHVIYPRAYWPPGVTTSSLVTEISDPTGLSVQRQAYGERDHGKPVQQRVRPRAMEDGVWKGTLRIH